MNIRVRVIRAGTAMLMLTSASGSLSLMIGTHRSTKSTAPTSGLYSQVGHDLLGADDVDSLALILALVMKGNPRDPECS